MTNYRLHPIPCHSEERKRRGNPFSFLGVLRIATASEQRNKAMCSRSSEEIHSLRFRLRQKAHAANCAWFIPSSSPNKRKFLLLGTHYAHRHIALFFLSPLKVKPSMGAPGRLAMAGPLRRFAPAPPEGGAKRRTDCHSQSADWLRNDKFYGNDPF